MYCSGFGDPGIELYIRMKQDVAYHPRNSIVPIHNAHTDSNLSIPNLIPIWRVYWFIYRRAKGMSAGLAVALGQ